ncbi:MAG: uncharacterized protein KVP18_001556 [Porospora cf. gigantea A]|uniref:uncharacterized protein n=1 Tax=Porospora cf. gigantea A TaxID=2853593 RepID=UPI00355A82E9|nr:MAG: hypothetical protein KVP18_001556 [Porospora cf. gigantea A]
MTASVREGITQRPQNVGINCIQENPGSSGISCLARVIEHCADKVSEMQRTGSFSAEMKSDLARDVLTAADRYCHNYVSSFLENVYPPASPQSDGTTLLVSEEGLADLETVQSYEFRRSLDAKGDVWILDPVDNTAGFVERIGGEYTIELALVRNGDPVFGIVAVPKRWTPRGAYKKEEVTLYYIGLVGVGSFVWQAGGALQRILPTPQPAGHLRVTAHWRKNAMTDRFIRSLGKVARESPESVLKVSCKPAFTQILRIAEGNADLYPRFLGSMEWDTAAAHAVLKAVGGECYNVGTEADGLVRSFDDFKRELRLNNQTYSPDEMLMAVQPSEAAGALQPQQRLPPKGHVGPMKYNKSVMRNPFFVCVSPFVANDSL